MPAKTPQEDLSVLFPDVEISVADPFTGKPVKLTVKEFRFGDGLAAQARARGLIDDLAAAMSGGQSPDTGEVMEILARHADDWLFLVSMACGQSPDWTASLADADAQVLSEAMWEANGAFLSRRVVAEAARLKKAAESPSPSPKSSTPS